MARFQRARPHPPRRTASVAALLVFALACSDSTAPAPAPATVLLVAGGDQSAAVATRLPVQLKVRALDAAGQPARSAGITWKVETGGGTIEPQSDRTQSDGTVQAVWTLGPRAGVQRVTASAAGVAPLVIEATAAAGAAAAVRTHAGDGQTALAGTAVPTIPSVRVQDEYDNPVADVTVKFTVTAGGGSVTGGDAVTDAEGIARVESWTVGVPGPNAMSAAVTGLPAVAFSAAAQPGDDFVLSVEGVHLNQGNQNEAGSIGGVAGRAGLLRVFVRASGPNNYAPPVRVRLYRGAALLREEVIPAPRHGVPDDPDRGNITHTWNLALTTAQVVEGLSVEASVDPYDSIPTRAEPKRFPRGSGAASLDVRPLHPLRITFLPIHATVQNTTGAITAANVDTFLSSVRQWIPGSSIAATVRPPYTTSIDMRTREGWSTLLSEIQALRTLEGAVDQYFHGIVGDFAGVPIGGLGYVPSSPHSGFRSALSYDRMPHAPSTIAHELGHNMGRWHNACGGPEGVDANYPHANSAVGGIGYDVTTSAVRAESSLRDYMSYCSPRWTSDYTYEGVLQWRRSDPLAQPAGAALVADDVQRPGLLVWGRIHSGGVTLNPVFALESRPVLPTAGGPNVLRGIAADGREVFRFAFDGVPLEDGDDPTERHFVYFIPLASHVPQVSRLELATPRGSAVLAPAAAATGLGAAARADLRVDPAAGGRTRIRWDAGQYPLVLVRDAVTGRVVSFARGGDVTLGGIPSDRMQIHLSDGVHSRTWQP